jgi:hypothetical protein
MLGPDEPEQGDYKNDFRTLCGHIEAKRKIEKSKLVEPVSMPVNKKGKNKPNYQSDEHQLSGSSPMFLSVGSICIHTSPFKSEKIETKLMVMR